MFYFFDTVWSCLCNKLCTGWLSICFFIYLFIYIPFFNQQISIYPFSIFLYIFPCMYVCACLCIYLYPYLSINLLMYLISLSVCRFVCFSLFLSILSKCLIMFECVSLSVCICLHLYEFKYMIVFTIVFLRMSVCIYVHVCALGNTSIFKIPRSFPSDHVLAWGET